MSFYRFSEDDIAKSTLETFPNFSFFINNGIITFNDEDVYQTLAGNQLKGLQSGETSLYELNVDRDPANFIKPFVVKDTSRVSFKRNVSKDYNLFGYGEQIFSKYPMVSKISSYYYNGGGYKTIDKHLIALQNISKHYEYLGQHFNLASYENKKFSWVNIPSIFFGTQIKPGSLSLGFYHQGEKLKTAGDKKRDGRILEGDKTIGIVFYDEGIILLFGEDELSTGYSEFFIDEDAALDNPRWKYFASSLNQTYQSPATSWSIEYQGIESISTVTMFAHAKQGQLNYSNNPTFIKKETKSPPLLVGTEVYQEPTDNEPFIVANTKKTSENVDFIDPSVYITEILVYDKHRRLIGKAKLSKPVLKSSRNSFTFKLGIDF